MSQKRNSRNQRNKSTSQKQPVSKPVLLSEIDGRKNIFMQSLFIALFSFGLYTNSLWFDFNLDDGLMITENKFTKQGIGGIKEILTNDAFVGFFGKQKNLVAGGRYRPLSQVMFAIEYQIFGANPFPGHLINITMYAFLCWFLFLILRKLFKVDNKIPWYKSMPFIITVLFASHPLHTEVVANIKGRDEIMSLLGSLTALYYMMRYLESKKILHLLIALLFLFLGLLSKENAITFVAIIPLTLFVFRKEKIKDYLFITIALIGVAGVFMILRTVVLGSFINNEIEKELLNNPFLGSTSVQKYATILYTWLIYIKLLFIPHPLTHDYYPKQIPIIGIADIRAIAPLVIYSVLTIWACVKIQNKNIIAYSILFFVLSFSIVSNLVFPIGTFMNERFMFISLLGFCIIVSYFIVSVLPKWIKDKSSLKNVSIGILVVILSAYSLKTFTRNFVWKDGYTLFTTDAKTSTNSAKCNVSAGELSINKALKEKDETVKRQLLLDAVNFLNKGVAIHPLYVGGWLKLGDAHLYLEEWQQSIISYQNALKINPTHKDALNNLLYVAQKSNDNGFLNESMIAYKTLINYQPDSLLLYTQLADVFEKENKVDSAIYWCNMALKKNARFGTGYTKLGEIYGKMLNDINTSISFLLKAYEINPKDVSTLENLGVAYGIKSDFQKSIQFFEAAIKITPDNPQLYTNLAGTYMNMGNKTKAAELRATAQSLQIKTSEKK